jgi:hypothetical protein
VPALAGYPAVGTPATVTLLSPGAAPRAPVRYRIAPGTKNTMAMSMAMSMAMTMGEMAAPALDMPVMKLTADLTVTSVAANGDATYDLQFTGMDAETRPGQDPSAAAMLKSSAQGITAIKGTVVVSNRGVNRSARFDLDKVGDPMLKQMLGSLSTSIESMSTPLPEEAIGVGARWEVRQAFTTAGTATFQRAEYELVSADTGGVTMRVSVDQTAPRQMVDNPALPPGATMEVEKISGTGAGSMTLRLDSLVPSGELSSTSNAQMNATVGGQSQRIVVETKIKMTIRGTPGT